MTAISTSQPALATDTVLGLPAPALTHALLAPAGADLAAATGWAPQVSGCHPDGSLDALPVVVTDLPAQHPFWGRAPLSVPGVAAALLTVAGEDDAVQVTCCHAGHAPVTVLIDLATCAGAALLAAAGTAGLLELAPGDDLSLRARAVLPDPLLALTASAAHQAGCGHCGL